MVTGGDLYRHRLLTDQSLIHAYYHEPTQASLSQRWRNLERAKGKAWSTQLQVRHPGWTLFVWKHCRLQFYNFKVLVPLDDLTNHTACLPFLFHRISELPSYSWSVQPRNDLLLMRVNQFKPTTRSGHSNRSTMGYKSPVCFRRYYIQYTCCYPTLSNL